MRASRSEHSDSQRVRAPNSSPSTTAKGGRAWVKYAVIGILAIGVGGYFLGRHFLASHHLAAAERALDERNFSEAKIQLDKCLSLRPDDPTVCLLLVRTARRAEKYEEAVVQLSAAREKFPGDTSFDRERFLLRIQQQGDWAEVGSVLSECLAHGETADPLALEAAIVGGLKPLLFAFTRLETLPGGKAYSFLQKVQQGTELWLRLRPNRPDQAQGLTWRGLTHAYANDKPKSLVDFRAALELDPNHHDARLQVAMSISQESPLEAAGHLERLLRHHPDDDPVKYSLAIIYRNMGRSNDARRLLDEILSTRPDNLMALIERGSLAIDERQFDVAERYLSHAIALSPENPQVNFMFASYLRAVGRPAEAETYHKRFLHIQGGLPK